MLSDKRKNKNYEVHSGLSSLTNPGFKITWIEKRNSYPAYSDLSSLMQVLDFWTATGQDQIGTI